MPKTPFLRIAVTALLGFLCAGAGAAPLRVVASFSILADMVRQVGGEDVEVVSLVGPDGDAHVFEPRPADAQRLAQARLVVVNGLGFEGWIGRLVKSSGYRGPLLVASQGVKARHMDEAAGHAHGHGDAHGHDAVDPHAWQDLSNGLVYVENIRAALVAALPAQAAAIDARARAYAQQLREADAFVRSTLGAIPAAQRRLITSHDAFGYFGAAYGLSLLSPQGASTESEASAADVAGLIRQMRASKVRAVFVENISNPRLIERIASEGGGVLGGRLYSDALSSGPEAASYVAMIRHNATTMAAAMRK